MEDYFKQIKYLMGDLHLGGRFVFKKVYSHDFETQEDYKQTLIENWNKKVTNDDDIVLVFGDLGFIQHFDFFDKVKGRKWLIKGNHDHYSDDVYSKYFERIFDKPFFVHDRIVVSHIPIPTEPGVINIHGHTHLISLNSERHINICPEHWEYKPVLFKRFMMMLGRIPKPSYRFLEEWYADIQIASSHDEDREDLFIREDGTIDAEKSKPLVFEKKRKYLEEKAKKTK